MIHKHICDVSVQVRLWPASDRLHPLIGLSLRLNALTDQLVEGLLNRVDLNGVQLIERDSLLQSHAVYLSWSPSFGARSRRLQHGLIPLWTGGKFWLLVQ